MVVVHGMCDVDSRTSRFAVDFKNSNARPLYRDTMPLRDGNIDILGGGGAESF